MSAETPVEGISRNDNLSDNPTHRSSIKSGRGGTQIPKLIQTQSPRNIASQTPRGASVNNGVAQTLGYSGTSFSKSKTANQVMPTPRATDDIITTIQELMELLEFHGVSRMKFSLEPEDIKFQKLVVMLKQILKT